MPITNPRFIAPTDRYFVRSKDVKGEPIRTVEDKVLEGDRLPEVKSLFVTGKLLCTQVVRPKGLIDPPHKHLDHESVFFLISGKLRLVIGDKEFIAYPGDYWIHPVGVEHYTEMLEDSVNIEVKVPPVKTWNHPGVGKDE